MIKNIATAKLVVYRIQILVLLFIIPTRRSTVKYKMEIRVSRFLPISQFPEQAVKAVQQLRE